MATNKNKGKWIKDCVLLARRGWCVNNINRFSHISTIQSTLVFQIWMNQIEQIYTRRREVVFIIRDDLKFIVIVMA